MRVMVENVEGLEEQLRKTREAQAAYAKYSQEEVDKIFLAAATAANKQHKTQPWPLPNHNKAIQTQTCSVLLKAAKYT